jgi:O-antigen biosynthesis protein
MEECVSLSLRDPRTRLTPFLAAALRAKRTMSRALTPGGRRKARSRRGARAVIRLALMKLLSHATYHLQVQALRRVRGPVPVRPVPPLTRDAALIAMPFAVHPVVSVIIPTYGKVEQTLTCLASIAEFPPAVQIEVIVVDDAWPGPETNALAHVSGIRLIRNDFNIGFLHSCNLAAQMARGRYLYFLNNDTYVLPDWLDPMVTLFRLRPDTGVVGAKLLDPDGWLQAAGGLIWRDATSSDFGNSDNPERPQYNYVRESDYCSSAALMVDRAVFARLGGFDERFAPGGLEDADLCFRLRREGLKVLFQPAATVVHTGRRLGAGDATSRSRTYQEVNRQTFLREWHRELSRAHYPAGERVLRARERAMYRKVVLVVDHQVPLPDVESGWHPTIECLEFLLRAGHVVKFWPLDRSDPTGYLETLQAMGVEVSHGAHQTRLDQWLRTAGCEIDIAWINRPDGAGEVTSLLRIHSNAVMRDVGSWTSSDRRNG